MKIEIKLDDPKLCNGCPLIYSDKLGIHCALKFWFDAVRDINGNREHVNKIFRPQICIDKYGL